MNMSIKDANGTFIKNTFSDPKPLMFPVKFPTFEGDIYDAIGLLSAGDSAHFLICADSMYQHVFKKEMPSNLKKGSDLDIIVKVFDIQDQKERIQELVAHADTTVSDKEKKRRAAEDLKIQAYLKELGYEFKKTPLGVYYTQFSKGSGPVASEKGKIILINFTGRLLNNQVFETTYNQEDGLGRPVSINLGKKEVIAGWEDLLVGKREGDRIKCVIPSHLAFGAQAKGNTLPANAVLVFDIDVMQVR
jgi:FKBP-type peptidyl-prolyl cis-trans isomerase FkpA